MVAFRILYNNGGAHVISTEREEQLNLRMLNFDLKDSLVNSTFSGVFRLSWPSDDSSLKKTPMFGYW